MHIEGNIDMYSGKVEIRKNFCDISFLAKFGNAYFAYHAYFNSMCILFAYFAFSYAYFAYQADLTIQASYTTVFNVIFQIN